MNQVMKLFMLLLAISVASACSQFKKTIVLDEMSGVWLSPVDNTLVTLLHEEGQLHMLIGDLLIPVTVGETDEDNDTVNLRVTTNENKPGIWTLRQLWDKDHKRFNLQITMHDGTASDMSFVRKISGDDKARIKQMTANAQAGSAPVAVASPAVATTEVSALAQPVPAETEGMFSPSFDCQKASNGAERLICSSQQLAELDVQMSQTYRDYLGSVEAGQRSETKQEQGSWVRQVRNACASVDCMASAYQARIEEMQAVMQYLGKPTEFR